MRCWSAILSTLKRSKRNMSPLLFSDPISNELAKNDFKNPKGIFDKSKAVKMMQILNPLANKTTFLILVNFVKTILFWVSWNLAGFFRILSAKGALYLIFWAYMEQILKYSQIILTIASNDEIKCIMMFSKFIMEMMILAKFSGLIN